MPLEAIAQDVPVSAPASRDILGHPRGLAYLAFAELWERFSYYGMQALLVLYMGQQLLLPGHVEHVVGFAAFRGWIEHVYGPLSPAALASVIFGLYAGGVYLTPLAGGFIADRVLGRTATVTLGALLMAIGPPADGLRGLASSSRSAACCWASAASRATSPPRSASSTDPAISAGPTRSRSYCLGINIAVIVSPLVCGTLGQKVAWHWGFGAAGVGMLIGLAVYLSGRRWLPASAPRGRDAPPEASPALPQRLVQGPAPRRAPARAGALGAGQPADLQRLSGLGRCPIRQDVLRVRGTGDLAPLGRRDHLVDDDRAVGGVLALVEPRGAANPTRSSSSPSARRSPRLPRCCSRSAARGRRPPARRCRWPGAGVPPGQRSGVRAPVPRGAGALFPRRAPAIAGLMIGVYYLTCSWRTWRSAGSADCWRPSAVDRSGSCTRA